MHSIRRLIKKQIAVWLVLCLGLSACSALAGSGPKPNADEAMENKKTRIYCSVYYLYDLSRKLAGDDFEVCSLLPSGTEVHDWEPGPQDMLKLSEASAFIYSGVGLENWLERLRPSLAQNTILVDSSVGVPLLKAESEHEQALTTEVAATTKATAEAHDHSHEHAVNDPHIWLNPRNVRIQMRNIAQVLIQLKTDRRSVIETRLAHEEEKLDALDQAFREQLAPYQAQSIIVGHEAFAYLCEAYGLKQIGIEGLLSASEPSPGRMAEIVKLARQEDIRVIFTEKLASSKVAESLAREIGGQVAVLDPYEGLSPEEEAAGEDYYTVMQKNLSSLLSSFKRNE